MSVTEFDQDGKPIAASYEDDLRVSLRNPTLAKAYLNASLEDDDYRVFLLALRDVAESFGIAKIATTAGLNRENVYRMLSDKGNPRISSLMPLIRAIGLRLSAELEKKSEESQLELPYEIFSANYMPVGPGIRTEAFATMYSTTGETESEVTDYLQDSAYRRSGVISLDAHPRRRGQRLGEQNSQEDLLESTNRQLAIAA